MECAPAQIVQRLADYFALCECFPQGSGSECFSLSPLIPSRSILSVMFVCMYIGYRNWVFFFFFEKKKKTRMPRERVDYAEFDDHRIIRVLHVRCFASVNVTACSNVLGNRADAHAELTDVATSW